MTYKSKYTISQLIQSSQPPPDTLDYVKFEFEGIIFNVYGILHGITGALNHEYRNFIKESIRSTNGLKLAEKGMKQLYPKCGINNELEDWLVLRKIDCLVMGFQLIADPRCLWMMTIDVLREKMRQHDPFILNNRKNITDLGESPYYHYLDEHERRNLSGFLPSPEALVNDLNSMKHWYSAISPKTRQIKIKHPQWYRILLLERLMHIPCRSIHMLYYALAYAKKNHSNEVNLFVGETHNTDMQYLANNLHQFEATLSNDNRERFQLITDNANFFGKRTLLSEKLQLILKKINYLTYLLIGAIIPLGLYMTLFNWLIS